MDTPKSPGIFPKVLFIFPKKAKSYLLIVSIVGSISGTNKKNSTFCHQKNPFEHPTHLRSKKNPRPGPVKIKASSQRYKFRNIHVLKPTASEKNAENQWLVNDQGSFFHGLRKKRKHSVKTTVEDQLPFIFCG